MPKKRQKELFQPAKGTFDILPEDEWYWDKIYKAASKAADVYGFGKIETPIFENTNLFLRSVGETTDIAEKQMYSFKTRGGDALTLRPEGTAPISRAFISNGLFELPQPLKLWYWGPFFRHESPQHLRYREFHQFGFEIFGDRDSVYDALIIQIFANILKELGWADFVVEINSVGCQTCRPDFRRLLLNYYRSRQRLLCKDCKRRFVSNPLRLLDCKEEKCAELKSRAPQIIDHLCSACRPHFKSTLEFLDDLEIPYMLNPHLVRGLDYYSKTVFEFVSTSKEDKMAIASGGRYDNLVELLGGKSAPAVGGAAGIERLIASLKEIGVQPEPKENPKVFVVQLGSLAKRKSLSLIEDLRKAEITFAESLGRDSIKAQLKIADRLKAQLALIIGQKESLDNTIIIREMDSGNQETVTRAKIIDRLKKRLS
ncbi:MAG: histidine--tRNA ligase [Parcubacteria group bacterium]|nr:histidine--tRNA ligase [Parcubacteria group bacterium]